MGGDRAGGGRDYLRGYAEVIVMGVKLRGGDRTDAFSADGTGGSISDEVEVVPFEEDPERPHWLVSTHEGGR